MTVGRFGPEPRFAAMLEATGCRYSTREMSKTSKHYHHTRKLVRSCCYQHFTYLTRNVKLRWDFCFRQIVDPGLAPLTTTAQNTETIHPFPRRRLGSRRCYDVILNKRLKNCHVHFTASGVVT